jgi:glutamate racemase
MLGGHSGVSRNPGQRCHCRFFATDSVTKFQRLGARFLGSAIHEVELVDLGG